MMKNSGTLMRLDETLIDAGTSVSGCGPAFVCQVIEALARGGEKCGLNYEDALVMAEHTLIGTAKLLAETKVGLTDQIPVYRSYRGTLRRSRSRRYNFYGRMVQQYPEQLATGITCASGYRHSDLIHCQNH
jgi:hypothetical protein